MCPGCVLAAAPAHLLHVVRATNDYIARTHDRASMFATVFLGALDPETGVLDYVNGGHDAPVIAQSDGEMVRLHPTGPALGLLPDADFEVGKAQLEPGSTLLAFTDGFADAHGRGESASVRIDCWPSSRTRLRLRRNCSTGWKTPSETSPEATRCSTTARRWR